MDSDKAAAAQAAVELAQADLEAARLALQVALANQAKSVTNAEVALTAAQANYAYVTNYRPPSADVAQAQAEAAAADRAEAEALVAALQGDPLPAGAFSSLAAARTQVAQAELAIASAQLALANTSLTSPIAGTLTAIKAEVGEAVATATPAPYAAADLSTEYADAAKLHNQLAYGTLRLEGTPEASPPHRRAPCCPSGRPLSLWAARRPRRARN